MMTAAVPCCKLLTALHLGTSPWSGEQSCRRMLLPSSIWSPGQLPASAGHQKCSVGRRTRELTGVEKNADALAEEKRTSHFKAYSNREGVEVEVEKSGCAQGWEELRRRANSGAEASSSISSSAIKSSRSRARALKSDNRSSRQPHMKVNGHSERVVNSPLVEAAYGVQLQCRTRAGFPVESELTVERENAVNVRAAFDIGKGGFISSPDIAADPEDAASNSESSTITNKRSSTRKRRSEGFRIDAPVAHSGLQDSSSAPTEHPGLGVAISESELESERVYKMHRSTSSKLRKERQSGRLHPMSVAGRTRKERGGVGGHTNGAQSTAQGAVFGTSPEGSRPTRQSAADDICTMEPPLLLELLPESQASMLSMNDWGVNASAGGSARQLEAGSSSSVESEVGDQLDFRSPSRVISKDQSSISSAHDGCDAPGRRRAPNLQSSKDVVLSRGVDYAPKSASEKEEQRIVGQKAVKQVLAACQKLLPGERAASVLDRWQGQLRAIDCNQVVKELGRGGRWRRSLEVLEWMKTAGGDCAPNAITYVSVLSALGRAQELDEAEQRFEEMPEQGLKRNVVVFNTMMSVYVRCERPSDALALFPRMAQSGVLPDSFSYATAINACATSAAWLPRGISLFEQMRREGIRADAVVYNTLMKACSRGGQPAEAVRIFQQMQADGVEATLLGFNTLLDAHAEAGAWQEAFGVLNEMRTAGFVPDMASFNTLVKACCRVGKLREGLRVLVRMRNAGLRPNLNTFTLLISGCAKAGLCEEAAALFAELKKEGIRPDAVVFAAAIDASESLSRVEGYLQESAGLGLARTSSIYTALVRAYSRLGMVPRIAGAFLEARRQLSKLDVGLYNAAMEAYSQAGRVGDVQRVFDQLEGDTCTANEVSFTILMDAQGKAGLLSALLETLRRMETQGLAPGPVQLNVAIDAFAKAGEVERAQELFEESVDRGVEPGVPAYNSLLSAYARAGRVGDCVKVYRSMRKAGVRPTVETYSVLIDAFGRTERIAEAEAVFRRLGKEGLRPDLVAFTAMLTAYGRAGMGDEAIECFRQMQRAGFVGDLIAYTALMSGLQRQGRDNDLLSVYDEMVAAGIAPDAVAVVHQVSALCRLKRGDEAEATVAASLLRGAADARSVTPLVELLVSEGRVQRAHGWLDRMRAGGLVPEVGAYSAVIAALGRLRQFDEAAVMFEEMQRTGVGARLTPFDADALQAIVKQARQRH